MVLSPAEAALRLKISERRVRALLQEGRIPAQRVSGRWIIDEFDVSRYHPVRPAGRPLSERSAWQFITQGRNLDARLPSGSRLSPVEKHRLNKRLERLQTSPNPLGLLLSLLGKRAQKVELSSNPADIEELRGDPRLRLSGVSHPDSGLLTNSEVEAYVGRRDYEAFVTDWFLVKPVPGQRANVILHVAEVVPKDLPPLAIAADLAERPGVREQEAALEIIRRIHAD